MKIDQPEAISLYRQGWNIRELASRYGVSFQAIQQSIGKKIVLRPKSQKRVFYHCEECHKEVPTPRRWCCRKCYRSSRMKQILLSVQKTDACWWWKGHVNKVSGYGQVCIGKPYYAHRWIWSMVVGRIPKGMWVLHKCDNKICVRPDHLFLGIARDNNADRDEKGRGVVGVMKPKDIAHCATSKRPIAQGLARPVPVTIFDQWGTSRE